MSDKILIIVGDATETVDIFSSVLRVQEDGFEPVFAGPEARSYNMMLHEIPAEGCDINREFEGYTIQADIAFRDVWAKEYAGCVEGRRIATVPKCQLDLEVCGGTFVNESCVSDGNWISGHTWHDRGQYMKHWMNLLIIERERMYTPQQEVTAT